MAREEHDREDLLREATALVERIELRTVSEAEPIVIGFRRDGCASVYFGGDPAYHFNTRNELRRAFVAGQLWKADQGSLIAMQRVRTGTQVELHSQPLPVADQQVALQELLARLIRLTHDLTDSQRHSAIGVEPPNADILPRVRNWLVSLRNPFMVAASPHAV